MNYITGIFDKLFNDQDVTDVNKMLSAGKYMSKHEDGYGDTCLKRCNKTSRIKEHCLSQRIDDVYFWNHKIRSHCKPLNSCKYNKNIKLNAKRNSRSKIKITKVESYTGCTEKEWLTSKDIDFAVQNIKHESFLYLTQMFWDKWESIKNGIKKTLTKHKNKDKIYFAWIYNFSSSNKKGTHWVCVFVEKTTSNIFFEYFDSFGNDPPKNVLHNLENMMDLFRNIFSDFVVKKLIINDKPFQRNSYDCGVWVIWYIHQRLSGLSLKKLQSMKNDEQKRRLYFVCPVKEKKDQKYIYISNHLCENNISVDNFQRIGIIGDGHCGYRTILLHNKLIKLGKKELTVNEIEEIDTKVKIDSLELHRMRELIYDFYTNKWPGGIPNEIRDPENNRLLQKIKCKNLNSVDNIEWARIETIVVLGNIFKIEVCCYERVGDFYIKKHMGLKEDDIEYQSIIHILNVNNLHFDLLIKK